MTDHHHHHGILIDIRHPDTGPYSRALSEILRDASKVLDLVVDGHEDLAEYDDLGEVVQRELQAAADYLGDVNGFLGDHADEQRRTSGSAGPLDYHALRPGGEGVAGISLDAAALADRLRPDARKHFEALRTGQVR